MAAEANVALVICKYCTEDKVKTCAKCKSYFCSAHAARFSPNFCKECLVNLTAVWEKFSKTTTEYDPVEDVLNTVTSGAKRLHVDGADWVFYSAWVDSLNDDELEMVYEFHYFVLKLIEHDNEIRKIKKARKLASAPTPIGVKTTKETKVKKTAEVVDMQERLEKMNLPADTIRAMLLAAGISYREPKV